MFGYNELVELCKRVKATSGLDTSIDRVVEYQDMIGHSTESQLSELSNSDYKKEFYWIYSTAYRIEDTINFYVSHSEKLGEIFRENEQYKDDNGELKDEIKSLKEEINSLYVENKNLHDDNALLVADINNYTSRIEALENEVMKLKAKIYDLSFLSEE